MHNLNVIYFFLKCKFKMQEQIKTLNQIEFDKKANVSNSQKF